MPPPYLLDANAVSDAMKGEPKLVARLATLSGSVSVSVVQGEIGYGLAMVPPGMRRTNLEAKAASVFLEYGALRDVEAWAVDTPVGEVTSFPRAVEVTDGESVVFSFLEWPDEATRNEAWKKVMDDERMKPDFENMPFDGKRMFWGGFAPIVTHQPAPQPA